MKTKFGKFVIAMITVLGLGLGTLALAAPANAAAPTGVVEISASTAADLPSNAVVIKVPAHTTRAELRGLLPETDNVWKILNSLVECEYWAGVYAVRYFPAATSCVWHNNAWLLVVILIR
jgi:hypothetical protein